MNRQYNIAIGEAESFKGWRDELLEIHVRRGYAPKRPTRTDIKPKQHIQIAD